MRRLLLAALLLIGGAGAIAQSCVTATCTAADMSAASVLAALPSGANPNATVVVNLPVDTKTWSNGQTIVYTVPAGITSLTIQGATVVTCTGTDGTAGYSCAATDRSIINDSVTNANTPLWVINTSNASTLFRITGLTIQPLNGTITAKSQGIVNFVGNTKNFRWDHSDIILSTNDNSGPEFDGQIEGVADHNLVQIGTAASFTNGFRIYNDLFDTVGFGDGGWAAPTQFGSQHAFFLESNYVIGGYFIDCGTAGRVVMRKNTFLNAQDASGAVHSTKDPAGAERGCRSEEFYQNYMSGTGVTFATTGGEATSLLMWGNTLGNLSNSYFYAGSGAWRSGPGQTPNEPPSSLPPAGWGMCGTVSNYPGTPGTASCWDGNSNAAGYPCLDGMGFGQQTQAMNGLNFPNRLNTATGTCANPQQLLEPVYLFNNTLPAGMSAEISSLDASSQVDRNIYYDCNSYNSGCSGGFTGVRGTGSGPANLRPAACTPGPGGAYGSSPGGGSWGVAYWETDNLQLDICKGTNTWLTGAYKPFGFPHPLVTGVSTCSDPVQNGPNFSGLYTVPPTTLPLPVSWGSPTPGCAMYATFDGSAPVCGTGAYSGSSSLSVTTTIRVIACQTSYTSSAIKGGTWTIQNAGTPAPKALTTFIVF